jgi:hypothetical protein
MYCWRRKLCCSYLTTKVERLELKHMTFNYFNVVEIRKEMIWISCCDVSVASW